MPQKYKIHLEFLPDITNHSRSNYVIVMDMGNVHHNISCLNLEDNFLTEFFKLEHIEIMMQKLTVALSFYISIFLFSILLIFFDGVYQVGPHGDHDAEVDSCTLKYLTEIQIFLESSFI